MNDATTQSTRQEPMRIDPTQSCPGQFYAFGASYVDGYCHNGHLDDADGDRCYEDFDYKPCPWCRNDEYRAGLVDGGQFTPPFGYGAVVPGDYFAISPCRCGCEPSDHDDDHKANETACMGCGNCTGFVPAWEEAA